MSSKSADKYVRKLRILPPVTTSATISSVVTISTAFTSSTFTSPVKTVASLLSVVVTSAVNTNPTLALATPRPLTEMVTPVKGLTTTAGIMTSVTTSTTSNSSTPQRSIAGILPTSTKTQTEQRAAADKVKAKAEEASTKSETPKGDHKKGAKSEHAGNNVERKVKCKRKTAVGNPLTKFLASRSARSQKLLKAILDGEIDFSKSVEPKEGELASEFQHHLADFIEQFIDGEGTDYPENGPLFEWWDLLDDELLTLLCERAEFKHLVELLLERADDRLSRYQVYSCDIIRDASSAEAASHHFAYLLQRARLQYMLQRVQFCFFKYLAERAEYIHHESLFDQQREKMLVDVSAIIYLCEVSHMEMAQVHTLIRGIKHPKLCTEKRLCADESSRILLAERRVRNLLHDLCDREETSLREKLDHVFMSEEARAHSADGCY